jgi:hypothetical protein
VRELEAREARRTGDDDVYHEVVGPRKPRGRP